MIKMVKVLERNDYMNSVINIPEIFGSDVFNETAMKNRLKPDIYNSWKTCIANGTSLQLDVANEIAEAMKISVYYLTHLFKEATGATLTEYRNEFRVTRAKELLINTDQPIGVIAQECGFCSAAYFSEVFSGEERISPREYRILHRQS